MLYGWRFSGGGTYFGVLFGRSLGQIVVTAMHALRERRQRRGEANAEATRVLVYGTGERCLLFLKERWLRPVEQTGAIHVVGLLDPDPAMRSRLVKGYPVRGSLDQVNALVEEYNVDEIILTLPPSAEEQASLHKLIAKGGVRVREWSCALNDFAEQEGDALAKVL